MRIVFLSIFLLVFSNACDQLIKAENPRVFLPAESTIMAQRIDSLMEGYDYYKRFSGTVFVAHKDQVLYAKSFGYADAERGRLNKKTSVYGYALGRILHEEPWVDNETGRMGLFGEFSATLC